MKYTLAFSEEARADLKAIHDWYEEEREGLGEEFLEELDESLDRLKRSPEIHPLITRRMRRKPLKRFPYLLFYYIDKKDVVILGARHTSRHPHTWPNA